MDEILKFCPLWGEWEAEKKLGTGSFGTVWKMCRKTVGGQTHYAAVKHISIPRDESEIHHLLDEGIFTSEESATRYYNQVLSSLANEIDTMNTLKGYTNIVSYEDHKIIPKENGIGYDLFLRMELLTPLTERMHDTMTTDDVVKLGKDIATAIDILEKHQLIHRDIKPQNIFINDTGDYKLGDYGTARALNSDATAMSRKGTFNYMAPEIYHNQPASSNVDIYSLGLVLYRLLNCNRLPFLPLTGDISSEMSEEAFLRRIRGDSIPAPKNADPRLASIVLKAIAFESNNRYQNAREFLGDLEDIRIHSLPFQDPGERVAVAAVVAAPAEDGDPLAGPVRISFIDTVCRPVHEFFAWHQVRDRIGIAPAHLLHGNNRLRLSVLYLHFPTFSLSKITTFMRSTVTFSQTPAVI